MSNRSESPVRKLSDQELIKKQQRTITELEQAKADNNKKLKKLESDINLLNKKIQELTDNYETQITNIKEDFSVETDKLIKLINDCDKESRNKDKELKAKDKELKDKNVEIEDLIKEMVKYKRFADSTQKVNDGLSVKIADIKYDCKVEKDELIKLVNDCDKESTRKDKELRTKSKDLKEKDKEIQGLIKESVKFKQSSDLYYKNWKNIKPDLTNALAELKNCKKEKDKIYKNLIDLDIDSFNTVKKYKTEKIELAERIEGYIKKIALCMEQSKNDKNMSNHEKADLQRQIQNMAAHVDELNRQISTIEKKSSALARESVIEYQKHIASYSSLLINYNLPIGEQTLIKDIIEYFRQQIQKIEGENPDSSASSSSSSSSSSTSSSSSSVDPKSAASKPVSILLSSSKQTPPNPLSASSKPFASNQPTAATASSSQSQSQSQSQYQPSPSFKQPVKKGGWSGQY